MVRNYILMPKPLVAIPWKMVMVTLESFGRDYHQAAQPQHPAQWAGIIVDGGDIHVSLLSVSTTQLRYKPTEP